MPMKLAATPPTVTPLPAPSYVRHEYSMIAVLPEGSFQFFGLFQARQLKDPSHHPSTA